MTTLLQQLLARGNRWHSVRSYNAIVARFRRQYRNDYDMAMIASIGALSPSEFAHRVMAMSRCYATTGCAMGCRSMIWVADPDVPRWRCNARAEKAAIWARTSSSLRSNICDRCPGYDAVVHRALTIAAPSNSQDMIFHWSVFTHLYPGGRLSCVETRRAP
ncbi:MAG: hypothetical protein ABIO86_12535 [Sphingomonas sp.]